MGDRLGIPAAAGLLRPLSFSPGPPVRLAPQAPTSAWPLAPHRAQSGRLPSSRRPSQAAASQLLGPRSPSPSPGGWPSRTPAADLGCLGAASKPLRIQLPGTQMTILSPSEASLASLRQSRRLPHPQPHPQPQHHPRRHTHPASEIGQEPETPGNRGGERGRGRQQEDHTGFPSPDLHTFPPPFWVSTRPLVDPTTPSPTDTLTHTLTLTLTLWPGGGV